MASTETTIQVTPFGEEIKQIPERVGRGFVFLMQHYPDLLPQIDTEQLCMAGRVFKPPEDQCGCVCAQIDFLKRNSYWSVKMRHWALPIYPSATRGWYDKIQMEHSESHAGMVGHGLTAPSHLDKFDKRHYFRKLTEQWRTKLDHAF